MHLPVIHKWYNRCVSDSLYLAAMPFVVKPTRLSDVLLIEPTLYPDARGYFYEAFNERDFCSLIGRTVHFVQDNRSLSHRGVVRGLHYQLPPYAQAKLVSCIEGAVFDVAVDLRAASPTFGQWVATLLSQDNHRACWIPEGFAHGFVALTEPARLHYKTNAYWNKSAERSIAWNDDTLAIDWPEGLTYQSSEKDAAACAFSQADTF